MGATRAPAEREKPMDDRERALQDRLAARLLGADTATRDAAYREVYEAFHTYLRTDSGRRSFVYRKRPLAEAAGLDRKGQIVAAWGFVPVERVLNAIDNHLFSRRASPTAAGSSHR